MKAMVLEKFNTDLVMQEVKEKEIKSNDIKVRIKARGVCRSDLKIKSGLLPICKQIKFPHILGHEIAGEIVDKGNNVNSFNIGDRVVLSLYCGCGECEMCKVGEYSLCEKLFYWAGFKDWGGFAEYIVVPARAAVHIGENISFEEASIVPCAIGTAYKAVKRKAKIKEGDNVLIIGAGGLGLHALQIAKHFGAKVIVVDKDINHLNKAKSLGADAIVKPNIKIAREACQSLGVEKIDAVIDIVGIQESIMMGLDNLKRKGKMIIVGFSPGKEVLIEPYKIMFEDHQIIGSRNCSIEDIKKSVEMISKLYIKPVIDEIEALENVNNVFKKLAKGQVLGRIVLK